MPRLSEKIIIEKTQFDKRIKLTDYEKKLIVRINQEDGLSQRVLANMFKVSRRTIQFILNPEKLVENRKRRDERGGSKIYYDKEINKEYQKTHRNYKQKLYLEKKISLPLKP